jgi:hypothetical protein
MILSVVTLAILLGAVMMSTIYWVGESIVHRRYPNLIVSLLILAALLNCAFNFPVKK